MLELEPPSNNHLNRSLGFEVVHDFNNRTVMITKIDELTNKCTMCGKDAQYIVFEENGKLWEWCGTPHSNM